MRVSAQRAVHREPLAPGKWESQHPLPDVHFGQHAFHKVGRRRAHAPAHARRAKPSALTRKSHKVTLVARPAPEPREASTKQPAVQVRLKLFLSMLGQLDVERAVVDGPVECLQVVAHDFVKRRELGPVTFVLASVSSGGKTHTPLLRERRASAVVRLFRRVIAVSAARRGGMAQRLGSGDAHVRGRRSFSSTDPAFSRRAR